MAFKARCPYCRHVALASQEAIGASARCPKCGDFFTLAPEEDDAVLPSQWSGRRSRPVESSADEVEQPDSEETNDEVATETALADEPDDAAKDRRSFLQPAGVVALFLGGVALLSASFPRWNWLTAPLSLSGLALGIVAVGWVRTHRTPGLEVSVAGTFVSLAVLAVALLFPSLLGPAYFKPPAPAMTGLEVIPLQLIPGQRPALDEKGFVDSSQAALQQGSIRVQVVSAAVIGPLPKKQTQPSLEVRLRVLCLEDSKELVSKGLAFSGASGTPLRAALKDSSGRTYQQTEVKTFVPDEKEARLSAFPVAVIDEVVRFEPAPPPGQDLRLEVPTDAWGGSAVFRFVIPSGMIGSESPRQTGRGG